MSFFFAALWATLAGIVFVGAMSITPPEARPLASIGVMGVVVVFAICYVGAMVTTAVEDLNRPPGLL